MVEQETIRGNSMETNFNPERTEKSITKDDRSGESVIAQTHEGREDLVKSQKAEMDRIKNGQSNPGCDELPNVSFFDGEHSEVRNPNQGDTRHIPEQVPSRQQDAGQNVMTPISLPHIQRLLTPREREQLEGRKLQETIIKEWNTDQLRRGLPLS
jgi:hypothetical protein